MSHSTLVTHERLNELLAAEKSLVEALAEVERLRARFRLHEAGTGLLGGAEPPRKLYYMQDNRGVVGNCAVWWKTNGNGYTCDLAEAHVYTEEEIARKTWRETDVPWPKDEMDALAKRHVSTETRPWPLPIGFTAPYAGGRRYTP